MSDHSGPSALGVGLRGVCMGVAEILPGISGGTVAYITRIYPQLVENIAASTPSEISKSEFVDWMRRIKGAVPFLVPLGVGMVVGIVVTVLLVDHLLDTYEREVWGLVFGLMAGAAIQLGRDTTAQNLYLFGTLGLLLGLLIAALNSASTAAADPSMVLVFIGGFVAFTAWILPGVSGSMLLLIIGIWAYMVSSFANLHWLPILVFLCGLGCSVLFVPRLIQGWLRNHKERLIGIFCGLLLGSLVRVWPWMDAASLPTLPNFNEDLWEAVRVITLIVCGFTVMMTVIFYERQRKPR